LCDGSVVSQKLDYENFLRVGKEGLEPLLACSIRNDMNRIKRIVFSSAFGFSFLVIPVHFWMTDSHGVMQQAFFFQAPLSKLSQQCSPNSPNWLKTVSLAGVDQLKALSTQVAFLDENGRLSHCETGWRSTMFFSRRVSSNTRFRYGSLTKPVTASAIVILINEGVLDYRSSLADSLSQDVTLFVNEDLWGVTVEKLLRHRSGIQGEIFVNRKKPSCPDGLAAYMADGKVKGDGEFEYSNMGYCLLGEVVAYKAGRPYKKAVDHFYGLANRGMRFVKYEEQADEVERDFRFNDFYGINNKGRFDYESVAATAGLSGSASAYSFLIRDMINKTHGDILAGFDSKCDHSKFKNCYGYGFYSYAPPGRQKMLIKEGYMPGSSGVVVINEKGEVFVWLGNSDTENASSGIAMKNFLDSVSIAGF